MDKKLQLPETSLLIPNNLRASESRGSILSVLDYPVQNVSIITSEKGSIRSNHYHKSDFHFMYVLYGKINYFFKKPNGNEIHYISVENDQTIFTPALEWHATHFPIETKLVVCSKNPRDHKTYEKDTIRENLINSENIENYLKQLSNEK